MGDLMNRIIYVLSFLLLSYYTFNCDSINAISLLKDTKIFNYDFNDKYVVFEHEITINSEEYHYISILDIENNTINKILSNNGNLINSNMYFPSISDNQYIVFTSRATNITDDIVGKCIDIADGLKKHCNNIYVYNIKTQKTFMVKNGLNSLYSDVYEAKISGNGNSIVFESASENLTYNKFDCRLLNGISSCINIYKYNLTTNTISLVSTGKNNYGGNSNSVSPSISYDGRYITYQSNATNILPNYDYVKYCNNYINNQEDYCTNIFLVDSLTLETKIITRKDNQLFNNNSGNAIISGNGKYIAYESYSTDFVFNDKSHIYLYDINSEKTRIITKRDNVLNNRDSYLEDISNDGKYIIYKTDSTNIERYNLYSNLYVFNSNNGLISNINSTEETYRGRLCDDDLIYITNKFEVIYEKIDYIPPVIEKNQVIYVLGDYVLNIKDKIMVTDNLSSREQIEVYIDDISVLEKIGEYYLNVTVVDEMNNVSNEIIKVIVEGEDKEGPIFTDITEIKILKGSATLNLNEYLEAVDKIDGNTRIYIIDDGNLNLETTGNYTLKLMSKDNLDNITYKEIKVIVYDNYDFSYFYEIILILGIIVVIIFSIIKVK